MKDILFEAQKESFEAFESKNELQRAFGYGAITMMNIFIAEIKKRGLCEEFNINCEDVPE